MFKSGLLLAAALAATTACKSARETNTTDETVTVSKQVEQAQVESKEAFERAKEAQEKAIDEQDDVAGAMEEVNEKRQELAEAEAKAQREQQESQQAQAAAQQEGQAASQQAQASQQRAAEQQQAQIQQHETAKAQAHDQQSAQARDSAQTQPQTRTMQPNANTRDAWATEPSKESTTFEATAPSGTRSLAHGALDQASSEELVIRREASEPLRIKIDANTKIERNGTAATATELAKGSNVTVTYRIEGNQPIAERVHIIQ